MKIYSTGMGWIDSQPGGLNRYYADYLNAMTLRGHEMGGDVYAPNETGAISNRDVSNIVSGHGRSNVYKRMRLFRERMKLQLQQQSAPQVFNPHFALYTSMITRKLIPAHIPIVTHFHGPWAMESRVESQEGWKDRLKYQAKKQVELMSYKRSDAFIVLSEYFRDILIEDYGVNKQHIHIVPGAVDTSMFAPHQDREWLRHKKGITPSTKVLFCARRQVKRMGIDRLIHAMRDVVAHDSSVRLLIAGDGPMRQEYENLIVQLGLSENVAMLGRISQEDLIESYQAADISIVPTVTLEGFGLVTVEALACGTPVLGTPYGGTKEILSKFSSSLLFEDASASSIAGKIISVVNGDVSLPSRDECVEHVKEHYTWNRVADQVTDIFKVEIDRRRSLR